MTKGVSKSIRLTNKSCTYMVSICIRSMKYVTNNVNERFQTHSVDLKLKKKKSISPSKSNINETG